MVQRRRDQHLQFYVTFKEKEIIDQNVERSKSGNFSNFIRQLALGYEPRPIDFSELRELNKQLGYMNRNLHQIVYRAAMLNDLHEQDYQGMLTEYQTFRKTIQPKLMLFLNGLIRESSQPEVSKHGGH